MRNHFLMLALFWTFSTFMDQNKAVAFLNSLPPARAVEAKIVASSWMVDCKAPQGQAITRVDWTVFYRANQ